MIQPRGVTSPQLQEAFAISTQDAHISKQELQQLKNLAQQTQLSEPERAALNQILDKARDSSKGFLWFKGSINEKELNQLKQLAAGQSSEGPTGKFVTHLENRVEAQARRSSSFQPVATSFSGRSGPKYNDKPSEALGQRLADNSANIMKNPHMKAYLDRKNVKPVLDDAGQLINYQKQDGSMMSYCAAGVENTLKQTFGANFRLDGHAYQMGNQMAAKKHPNGKPMFTEMPGLKPPINDAAARNLMKSLPAGAVVVWDRSPQGGGGPGDKYGHIAIALGDGRESSDRIREHFAILNGECRIFLPQAP